MKIYIIIIGTVVSLIVGNAQPDLQRLKYEYEIYKSPDTLVRRENILQKALFLKSGQKYSEACDELLRAKNLKEDTSFYIQFELALNLFLANRYNESYNALIDIPDYSRFNRSGSKILWLILLAEKKQWQICKEQLLLYADTTEVSLEEINNLPVSYNIKSPVKALKMSSVIPGMGQVYAGYPFKGFTSFCLNAGSICLVVYEFMNGYYICGLEAGLNPFIRFYDGGKKLSYKLAEEHNIEQEKEMYELYFNVINKIAD